MNENDETQGRELVPEPWRELDDTLADGPSPTAVPPEAKAWLADQRFLHGLLRAMHTQDAAAREGRIAAMLARIAGDGAVEPRRHWVTVAVAALLMASFAFWLWLPAALPTASAAVERAVTELARDVARRFRVVGVGVDGKGNEMVRHEFALVTRPGGFFRVTGRLGFGPFQTSALTIGSDGQELWATSANGAFQRAAPLAESERLLQGLGDMLDLGYLDVHALVKKLPTDFELAVVGRERDATGRELLRIAATRKRVDAPIRLRSAWLLCDEKTGMVTKLAADLEFSRGASRQLSIEYLGDEPPGLVEFHRPW